MSGSGSLDQRHTILAGNAVVILKSYRVPEELVEEVISHNRVRSEALGLELINDGKTLRLLNPQTGEFLRLPATEAAARARLAAKLRELGLDPDQL